MPSRWWTAQPKPVGYPDAYECSLRLDDGRRVRIRPILPSDADQLAEAIRTADAETLRLRFLGGPPPVTEALLDELTRIDYVNHFALVAFAGRSKRGVAVARYIASSATPAGGERSAEVAVAVTPEWRRVGLATNLLRMLAQRAAECGISAFTATYLAANRPVAELAAEGHARVLIAQGVGEIRAPLPDDEPS